MILGEIFCDGREFYCAKLHSPRWCWQNVSCFPSIFQIKIPIELNMIIKREFWTFLGVKQCSPYQSKNLTSIGSWTPAKLSSTCSTFGPFSILAIAVAACQWMSILREIPSRWLSQWKKILISGSSLLFSTLTWTHILITYYWVSVPFQLYLTNIASIL